MNYKTFVVGLAVIGLLVLPVLPAKAITATQPQAQIDSLIEQIANLQAQLASLQSWCLNYNAQYGCQTPPPRAVLKKASGCCLHT